MAKKTGAPGGASMDSSAQPDPLEGVEAVALSDDKGATWPAEPVALPEPVAPETKTVDEWHAELFPPVGRRRLPHPDRWQHAAAAALHGWARHAHHTGAPLALTRDDYAAALAAACKPDSAGKYAPHKPAQGGK